jgi:DNA-binding response OmpR family regulator
MTETARFQSADAGRGVALLARQTDAAVATAADDGESPSPRSSCTRLLVVDDTSDNRVLLSRLLRHAGYEVDTAEDGPAALRLMEEQPGFDLILLDVMMPGMSGIEVLEQIRHTHSATELPVIMVTALNGSEDVVNALEHGATDFVSKPFNFRVVLARLRTHLALKQAVDRVRELERGLAQRNAELLAANRRMKSDLEAAGKIQAALLPTTGPDVGDYRFAWRFNRPPSWPATSSTCSGSTRGTSVFTCSTSAATEWPPRCSR